MRSKYMKMCSFSLIIKRILIKAIMIVLVCGNWWQLQRGTVSGGGAGAFEALAGGVTGSDFLEGSLTVCVIIRMGIFFKAGF